MGPAEIPSSAGISGAVMHRIRDFAVKYDRTKVAKSLDDKLFWAIEEGIPLS